MSETTQFLAPNQVDRPRPVANRSSQVTDPGQRSPLEVSQRPHTHLSGSASQTLPPPPARSGLWNPFEWSTPAPGVTRDPAAPPPAAVPPPAATNRAAAEPEDPFGAAPFVLPAALRGTRASAAALQRGNST
ncbi:classical arabinogalactan protein 4-like [Amphibalanus amphitrite]|uniref:classical arabinogalactan protein 4-like n=1 Tax=Amphibalanus amphitrite TaxID=1232801 RepID=UPI001C926384|nr:classical arabinogalactan protein 4-like [Amphibalanus amphitrite]